MQALIRGLPFGLFLFMLAVLLAMAAVAFYAGMQARRRAALMESMPTSNIGMAADGYVEFEGRIEAVDGATLIAPLTRVPCAWYHAHVEKYVGKSPNSVGDGWVTVKDATSDTRADRARRRRRHSQWHLEYEVPLLRGTHVCR
jgi:hypothetical protein